MQKSKLQFNIQGNENVKFFHFTLSFFILIFIFLILAVNTALASETSGTIISGGNNGYAWSGDAGWMNFGATNSNIQITDSGITGYVWNDNYGWINMAPINGGITIAANGALSGYAWGSGLGWINFSGVTINSSGRFVGTASGTNIGTLTFDCTNCSVTTDYRPSSSRTVATTQVLASTVGAGGGTNIGGTFATPAPTYLTALNVPLTLSPTQGGVLSYQFTNDTNVTVAVPAQEGEGTITINVSAEAASPSLFTADISAISGTLFNIVAHDSNGNAVHTFAEPVKITLTVPEELEGRSDLGVYYLDEGRRTWVAVPGVSFTEKRASFFVDHLTIFAILAGQNITPEISVPKEVPLPFAPEGAESGGVTEPGATVIAAEAPGGVTESTEIPAQLFDINLEIESTKIADAKDLIARLLFTSFGRVPTPVDITFAIVNKEGETVYSKKDTITVQTQAVLTERFADIDVLIPADNYTLVVTTLYNTNVRDEFKQGFEVTGEAVSVPFWRSLWFWVVSGIILVFIFILAIKKMGDDEGGASPGEFSALSVRYMKDIR